MAVPRRLRTEAGHLRDILREVIKELNEHHKNVNIATATGSAASLLGGVLAVGAAILAVPTAGLTLPLAGAGAVLAGAGSAVCLGAAVVEAIIKRNNLSDVEERWETFQREFAVHYAEQSGSEEIPANILNIVGKVIDGAIEMRQGYKLIKGSVEAAKALKAGGVGAKLAAGAAKVGSACEAGGLARVAALGTKAVGKGFFILNVVLIPISLVDLVTSAAAASKNEPSEASAKLERMADFLDRVANGQL